MIHPSFTFTHQKLTKYAHLVNKVVLLNTKAQNCVLFRFVHLLLVELQILEEGSVVWARGIPGRGLLPRPARPGPGPAAARRLRGLRVHTGLVKHILVQPAPEARES